MKSQQWVVLDDLATDGTKSWKMEYIKVKQLVYMLYEHVPMKCKILKLLLQRNLIRRHDFKAYLKSLTSSSTLLSIIDILLMLFFSHIQVITYLIYQLRQMRKDCKHRKNIKFFSLVSQSDCQSPYIGGGSPLFSLQELEAYIIPGSVPVTGISFKFRKYILQSELSNISVDNAIVCHIPVHSILSKLTVTELREVAACHNITCHSRMKSRHIQNAIKNHMCEDCETCVAIFDAADDGAHQRRVTNLQATKKYQEKEGEKYKKLHLKSVIKHQIGR